MSKSPLQQAMAVVRTMICVPTGDLFNGGEMIWGIPTVLVGPPGGGKTSFFMQLMLSMDSRFFNLKPGSFGEGAFGVTPVPEGGYLEFPGVGEIVRAFPEREGLLLLDDLTSTPPSLQPALLDIPQERMIGAWHMGGRVRVMCATNGLKDAAAGFPIPPAVANRLAWLVWPDGGADEYCDYLSRRSRRQRDVEVGPTMRDTETKVLKAFDEVYDDEVRVWTGFIHMKGGVPRGEPAEQLELLGNAYPTKRSVEQALRARVTGRILENDADELNIMEAAVVGQEWVTERTAYARAFDVPTPKEFLVEGKSFTHQAGRLDRTHVLLDSCANWLELHENRPAAPKLWRFIHSIMDTAADVARPTAKRLYDMDTAGVHCPESLKVMGRLHEMEKKA